MTYLDDLKGKHVFANNTPYPDRKNLRFIGLSLTVTDSPSTDSTVVNFDGATLGGDVELDAGGSFGIGTGGAPVANALHILGPTDPRVRLEETAGSYGEFVNSLSYQSSLSHTSASGLATVTIDPIPLDGTSAGDVRFLYNTNTTGNARVYFYTGDAGQDIQHRLGSNENSILCLDSGDLEVGGAGNAADVILQGGAKVQIDETELTNSGDTVSRLRHTSASTDAEIRLDSVPTNGTGAARVRFFRDSVTTGERSVQVFKGDGSATVQHQLSSSANTALCKDTGDLEVGAAGNAADVVMQGGAKVDLGSGGELYDVAVNDLELGKDAAGYAALRLSPRPGDGTSSASVRLFQNTNTTGLRTLRIYSGDGTSNIQHDILSSGNTLLCRQTGDLEVGDTGNPADVILQGGAKVQIDETSLQNVNDSTAKLSHVSPSGNAILDLDATAGDGTSDVFVRMFRNTNTTGDVFFQVATGDGTSTSQHVLRTGGNSVVCKEAHDLEVGGPTNPADVILQGGAKVQIDETELENVNNIETRLAHRAATGNAKVTLSPIVEDGAGQSFVDVFLSTNTTGARRLAIFKGDGTTTQQHFLSCNANSKLCLDTGDLEVGAAGNAADVIMQGGAKVQIDETVLQNVGNSETELNHTAASGFVSIGVNPKPIDGTGAATVNFLRNTSTTGEKAVRVYKGDGTATVQHSLSSTFNSQLCKDTGDLEVGAAGNAADVVMQGGAKVQIGETELVNANSATAILRHTSTAGTAAVRIAPLVTDGTSDANIQMLFPTSTTGARSVQIFKGDGSTDVQHLFNGGGLVQLCRYGGDLEVGAAGNAADVILHNGCRVITGTGSPEGAVTAPVGSMYTRADGGAGSTLYIKESGAGNTGWVAK
jgi:hypothetical protein